MTGDLARYPTSGGMLAASRAGAWVCASDGKEMALTLTRSACARHSGACSSSQRWQSSSATRPSRRPFTSASDLCNRCYTSQLIEPCEARRIESRAEHARQAGRRTDNAGRAGARECARQEGPVGCTSGRCRPSARGSLLHRKHLLYDRTSHQTAVCWGRCAGRLGSKRAGVVKSEREVGRTRMGDRRRC